MVPGILPRRREFPVAPYLLIIFGFTLLAGYVAYVPTQPFDRAILDAVYGLRSAALDTVMHGGVAFLGETWPSVILAGLAVVWFWVRGLRGKQYGWALPWQRDRWPLPQ